MKTSRRKSLLISSVSMLLVAGVSLGTATFAWFTSSTSTTTSNLKFKTTKSSTLQIGKSDATTDAKWKSDGLNYGLASEKLLLPASSLAGSTTAGNWFTAHANSTLDGTAKKGTVAALTDGNVKNYVFMEQLNVRNAGSADVENVKIKFNLGADACYDYLRVAVVEAAGVGLGKADTGTFANSVYANNATGYNPISGIGQDGAATANTAITPIDASGEVTIDVGTLEAVTVNGEQKTYHPKYYNLYIWFEGQDADCVDANAGAVIPDIVFTVEGETVTETEPQTP
ncbi:MAG: hypothetical protein U0L20_08780 [Ruminococcus sp.]|nr:hypothetical protein [Ruminococcus sp.]